MYQFNTESTTEASSIIGNAIAFIFLVSVIGLIIYAYVKYKAAYYRKMQHCPGCDKKRDLRTEVAYSVSKRWQKRNNDGSYSSTHNTSVGFHCCCEACGTEERFTHTFKGNGDYISNFVIESEIIRIFD